MQAPAGNSVERGVIRGQISTATNRLAERRAFIYQYVLARDLELKYSAIAGDVFSRVRERLDPRIGAAVPDAVGKLTAIYDNLASTNPEDWVNAAHGCRRVLQDLADVLHPPGPDRVIQTDGRTVNVKMGQENYINRIVAFVESHSRSETFQSVVGSHLRFVGDRLDALFDVAQKGSHATVTRDEADRLVVYTSLLVGDLLALVAQPPTPSAGSPT